MKSVIRRGTFETNSSNCHALIWMDEEQYEDWQNNKIYIDTWENTIANEDFINREKEETPEEELHYRFLNKEKWEDYDYQEYETYDQEYTTKHGDVVHAIGYYGHD